MDTEQRVYCTFCRQTYLTSDYDTCSLCRKSGGLVDPMSPAALADLVAQKRQEVDPGQQLREGLVTGAHVVLLMWRLIRLLAAAVVMFALGVWLLFSPDLRANPRQLAFPELLLGLGVAGGGLFALAWAYLIWKSAQRDAAARAEERGGPPVGGQ